VAQTLHVSVGVCQCPGCIRFNFIVDSLTYAKFTTLLKCAIYERQEGRAGMCVLAFPTLPPLSHLKNKENCCAEIVIRALYKLPFGFILK